MTDETPVTPEPKLMWKRCPSCGQRVYNAKIDADYHKLNCPHDIKLRIQDLEGDVERLTGLVSGVSGHVEGLVSDPGVDLNGIAPWDEEEEMPHVTVQTSSIPVVRIPNPFDDDDDDEDLPAVR